MALASNFILYETRKALTAEEINAETYVDMKANKAVFDSLKNNPKVLYDGTHFSYKVMHEVKEKWELLYLVRKYPEGIAVIDLKDAYPNVEEDLQVLKTAGDIWLLCFVVFCGAKNGMKPVTNTAQRRARAQNLGLPSKPKTKTKKHEISKRTKLTNAQKSAIYLFPQLPFKTK
uniref:TFIIE beta domain-containing protein n=1 Tax=Kalanchoe fedtschenkoi TaxID=63787 RepID=A0A7N0T0K0_KALFE